MPRLRVLVLPMTRRAVIVVAALAILAGACSSTRPVTIGRDVTLPSFTTTTLYHPSADVVKTWPDKWCSLTTDMDRSAVRRIMGPPTNSAEDGSDDVWGAFQYDLIVFYKADGTVRNYQDSFHQVSDCPEDRWAPGS
jgi:hypothetical protein